MGNLKIEIATPRQILRGIVIYARNSMIRRGATSVLVGDIATCGSVIDISLANIDDAIAQLDKPEGGEHVCPSCYHALDACNHCDRTFEAPADRAARLEEEAQRAFRAGGDVLCLRCRREYRRHPMTEHRSHDGYPFLHRLCNGDIVKL